MQELLIIVPDLYLPTDRARAGLGEPALAGLEHLVRFGDREHLEEDWRAWLARWAGGAAELLTLAPAVVAAAAAPAPLCEMAWMASPVHLVASLTSLHLDSRSVLYLQTSELRELVGEFADTFRDSGNQLVALDGDALLLSGPAVSPVQTREPARAMAASLAESLPRGPGAAMLRRLGAEIEMWLHGHPINQARERRGELPVTSLWLWGGGPMNSLPDRTMSRATPHAPLAFGSDAFVQGLWTHMGAPKRVLPTHFEEVLRYSPERGAVLVVEAGRMLQSNRNWTLLEAVAEIDRVLLAPAVQALRGGALGTLRLVANDWHLSLRARHRLRLWRRARPGLSGLL